MSAPSTETRLLDQLPIMLHFMNRTSPETPLIILLLTWLAMLHMQLWAGAIIQGLYQKPSCPGAQCTEDISVCSGHSVSATFGRAIKTSIGTQSA